MIGLKISCKVELKHEFNEIKFFLCNFLLNTTFLCYRPFICRNYYNLLIILFIYVSKKKFDFLK